MLICVIGGLGIGLLCGGSIIAVRFALTLAISNSLS